MPNIILDVGTTVCGTNGLFGRIVTSGVHTAATQEATLFVGILGRDRMEIAVY